MAPGTVIAGFRVERPLRSSPEAVVHEATQLSLQRRVELAVYDDPVAAARAERGARRQAHLHHPSVLGVFETGESEHGRFVARRLLPAATLAQRLDRGPLDESTARRLMADVASALEAAHAEGLAHGSLTAQDVFVAGDRAYLAELVVADDEPGAIAADLLAYAGLVGRCRDASSRPDTAELLRRSWPARRRRVMLGAAAAATLVAAVGVALLDPGPSQAPAPAPPVPAGRIALGSDLVAGRIAARDCEGRRPGRNSAGCTLLPVDAEGRPEVVPRTGVIRAWSVRGARGGMAVQVLRRGSGGRFSEVGRSQFATVPGSGAHVFAADLPVRRGDLLALELEPGAGVGVREAPGGGGALTWIGPLELMRTARPADRSGIRGEELLVRFELVAGARRRMPPQAFGAAAEDQPAGVAIEREEVELSAGRVVAVSVVRVGDRIAVDLARSGRRVARIEVPDASPAGRLVVFEQGFTTADFVRLQWRNPGRRPLVIHGFAVRANRLEYIY